MEWFWLLWDPGPFEPRGVLIKWHLPGSRQYYEGILWGLYIHTNRLVDLYNTLLLYIIIIYYYIGIIYGDFVYYILYVYYIYSYIVVSCTIRLAASQDCQKLGVFVGQNELSQAESSSRAELHQVVAFGNLPKLWLMVINGD